jgi:hypothetical protein
MNAALTFQQIKDRYPGEWVLVGEPEVDASLNLVSGEVLAHSPSREEIYRQLLHVKGKRISIEYTGKVPADLAVAL